MSYSSAFTVVLLLTRLRITINNLVKDAGTQMTGSSSRIAGCIMLMVFLVPGAAFATSYTVKTPHLTSHVGDPPPPCILQVLNGTNEVGAGISIFRTPPTCSSIVTVSTAAGKYPIKLKAGILADRSDSQTLVEGSIDVIPVETPSLIGAKLRNNIVFPSHIGDAPGHPMIDMTANGIANLVGDCSTDNAAALLELLAFGRGTYSDDVNVDGTSVTATKGVPFTGILAGSPVEVDGVINHVVSVLDATHLTLKMPAGSLRKVQLALPPIVVDTDGSTQVAAASGPTFVNLAAGARVLIAGEQYVVAAVTDATHLQTTVAAPILKHASLYTDQPGQGSFGYISQYFHLPAGCYATSQPIRLYGNYWSLYGSGPQTSFFYLLPNTPAFHKGMPVEWFHPQSLHGNENFHEYVANLGFRVGVGNPDAVPITTEMNNAAAFRNVQIWADDSMCPYAVNFRRAYPGPGLFKDVAIYGCTSAFFSNQMEYSMTLEGLTVEGQTGLVSDDRGIKLSFRHVLSDNLGGFTKLGSHTDVVMLDSKLLNGAGTETAVTVVPTSSFFAQNTQVTGYAGSIEDRNAEKPVSLKGNVLQNWSGSAQSVFNSSQKADALHLPVEETPPDNDPDPKTWTQLKADSSQWQAQLDSSTSPTVYLPPGLYSFPVDFQLVVPDKVHHLNFFGSLAGPRMMTIVINGSGSSPLIVDGAPHNATSIQHLGHRTLVIKDMDVHTYETHNGSGNLFVENAGWGNNPPATFYASQSIWARQLNLEPQASEKFSCVGAKLWVLGYKTEHNPASITESNGCKAEIFGAFFYQLRNVPDPGSAVIKLTDSSLFIAGLFDFVNKDGLGTPNWVNEVQGGCSQSLPNRNVNAPGNNLSMFYSFGATASNAKKAPCPSGTQQSLQP